MKISESQARALGGCQECQPATTPPVKGIAVPLPSVVVADPAKPDWILLSLADGDGKPVAGEPFILESSDGTRVHGRLDNLGRVRIEGLTPGTCKVTFPERDGKEWRPA